MQTLKTILLATDLLPASQEAAHVAVQLAAAFGSRVTVLHVLEPMPHWPVALHEHREQVAQPLREFTGRLATQKMEVAEPLVAVGPPADTIVQKANEIDADLILIGAGELSRFERYSMGPVATAVIEHAPQPVLAVRPGGPAARFQKILCAVDQSGPAARGLRNAIRLARAFGGELVVLTVVSAVTPEIAAAVTGRFADVQTKFEAQWQGEFMKVLTDSDLSGIKVTKEVRHGQAHRQIIAAAEEHRADLIVMGATGRTGLARVLVGSTTRRVLEHLPCSLLTVKQEDIVEELIEEDIRTVHQLIAEARDLMTSASFDKAGAKYRQVLARNPFHVAAVEGLAEVSDKLGDSTRAQFYRRRVQAIRGQAQA
jgi:nucleotide-binding universal stress UspA family protein